ncbi:general transcription factor II-I repeat domain-containing protein 2-like [Halictus rubicundus]|uniref:general transcription factor II-I repeat domain-containing protein 2-like n=1 Tax=Halictus rubicundus TaxID=77578 RepID=UPI004036A040
MDTPSSSERPSPYSALHFKPSWEEDYFFVVHGDVAKCLLCQKQLNQVKKYNVQRHYKSYHEMDLISYTPEQRKEKLQALKMKILQKQEDEEDEWIMHDRILEVSYKIAYEIGKSTFPLPVGDLIKNSMTIAAHSLFPNELNKIAALGLSRSTITRRVKETAANIMDQLCAAMHNFIAFSLAIDDVTDVTGTPQVAIFIRGVDAKLNIVEELLEFCKMKGTTGEDVFSYVEETVTQNALVWHNLVSVATDRSPSMVCPNTGFISHLKQKLQQLPIPHGIVSVQCVLHRENLCAKDIKFQAVMSVVMRTINFIRNHGFRQTQLRNFLQELDNDYGELSYYADIHWLSRGKALDKFFTLREEIQMFMDMAGNPVAELADPNWVKDLAFLSDLVNHINILNEKLQGKNKTIIDFFDTVRAFKVSLDLWMKDLESGNSFDFPKLKSVSSDNTYKYYPSVLQNLFDEFSERFADIISLESYFDIIISPFTIDYAAVPPHLRTELIDLRCDRALNFQFQKYFSDIPEFYKTLPQKKYPQLHRTAAKIMSIFGSTYSYEQLFSILKHMKSTNRISLNNQNTKSSLILNTCKSFSPNFKELVDSKK